METVIVICLIIIIILLLSDKMSMGVGTQNAEAPIFKKQNKSNIMGPSKPVGLNQFLINETTTIKEYELDFEKEENLWSSTVRPDDDEFNQKVNYDEINAFVKAIEKDSIDEITLNTAKKLEGTYLIELLESSMKGASGVISKLLDQKSEIQISRVEDSKNSKEFDITDFV
ncbi:hypothetical protein [Flavobacterium sp. HSC-61S13]|uniref:hypothetical protein n=1 Tax=Flavobacterium sp. HSC-61S13 TaxID=2910963 RepID=UPI0020A1347A|nr:hypothetical protein [Flavobacterium sp. HSC-61S13]MCP1994393.1 hypothetical protein [Flavobacterium sp. HSC-61S13]